MGRNVACIAVDVVVAFVGPVWTCDEGRSVSVYSDVQSDVQGASLANHLVAGVDGEKTLAVAVGSSWTEAAEGKLETVR